MTKIPGIVALHIAITPSCRTIPRPDLDHDPAMAAFDEAVARIRKEYRAIVRARSDRWTGRLVLTVEAEPWTPPSSPGPGRS